MEKQSVPKLSKSKVGRPSKTSKIDARTHRARQQRESRVAVSRKHKAHKHKSYSSFTKMFLLAAFHAFDAVPAIVSQSPTELRVSRLAHMRGLVREVMGTQQPIIRCRTGMSNLTTTAGSVLQTVIQMDVSGVSGWASFAALFDEYRVRAARIKVLPGFIGLGSAVIGTGTGTVQYVRLVVDYDDSTAIANSTAALLYDAAKDFPLGSTVPQAHKLAAHPTGQPDLAWVTTATPSVPFWFKFYNLQTGLAASSNVATATLKLILNSVPSAKLNRPSSL